MDFQIKYKEAGVIYMGLLFLALTALVPIGIVSVFIFEVLVLSKKTSSVVKRSRQMQEDNERAAEQKQAQDDEFAAKVDELNNEINKYVRIKCPYCGSEADALKGKQFTCEHCGFTSANII